jgi:hypothetical protein
MLPPKAQFVNLPANVVEDAGDLGGWTWHNPDEELTSYVSSHGIAAP